jgi:hypothetical protein
MWTLVHSILHNQAGRGQHPFGEEVVHLPRQWNADHQEISPVLIVFPFTVSTATNRSTYTCSVKIESASIGSGRCFVNKLLGSHKTWRYHRRWRDRLSFSELVRLPQQCERIVILAVLIGAVVTAITVPELKGIWRFRGRDFRAEWDVSKNTNHIRTKFCNVWRRVREYIAVNSPSPKVNAFLVSNSHPEVLWLENSSRMSNRSWSDNGRQKMHSPWGLELEGRSCSIGNLVDCEVTQHAYGWGCATVFPVRRELKSMLGVTEPWNFDITLGCHCIRLDTLEVDKRPLNGSHGFPIDPVRFNHSPMLLFSDDGVVKRGNKSSSGGYKETPLDPHVAALKVLGVFLIRLVLAYKSIVGLSNYTDARLWLCGSMFSCAYLLIACGVLLFLKWLS